MIRPQQDWRGEPPPARVQRGASRAALLVANRHTHLWVVIEAIRSLPPFILDTASSDS
ncbi:hypothetical protein NSND_61352 [Nitrospira sp. ND1]|nr:hypothetical protein NSND_61352 [Nitrospira sp. ND1]